MEKQKKAPTFNLSKALTKKITSKAALSEIEFNLCSEEQKKEYIFSITGKKLSGFESKWCIENNIDFDANIKANLLKSGKRLSENELKQYSVAELVEYMEGLLNKYDHLSGYEKKLVTKERYQKWLHGLIDKKLWLPDEEEDFPLLSDDYKRKCAKLYSKEEDSIDMPFEIFEWLDENEKILYVANNGLYNLDDPYEKWFKSWKKGYDRQKQIDSVLN